MTQIKSQSAELLLERTREQVRVVMGVIFLSYLLLVNVLKIPAQTAEMQSARWWGLGAVIGLIILNTLGILKSRLFNLVLAGVVVVVMWLALRNVLIQELSPIPFMVWSLLLSTIFFVMLGSVAGMTLSLMLGAGLSSLLYLHFEGSYRLDWLTGTLVFLGMCMVNFTVMQFIERHIVLHDQATDKLRAARLDALTGVQGRAALEEELRRATLYAQKNGTPLSIIMTDIDYFKRVNDKYGHSTGDDVLRSFAKRLRRNVGTSGGTVGRWGGEEFLIMLPDMARPDAMAMAEELRRQVIISPIAGLEITASFGVASYRRGETIDELFSRADQRLYEAKNAGRNVVR